jgi:hypothetical protein
MAVFLASAENVLTNWRGLFPEAEVEHYVFLHEPGAAQNWAQFFVSEKSGEASSLKRTGEPGRTRTSNPLFPTRSLSS